jgi:hypothetical protein
MCFRIFFCDSFEMAGKFRRENFPLKSDGIKLVENILSRIHLEHSFIKRGILIDAALRKA